MKTLFNETLVLAGHDAWGARNVKVINLSYKLHGAYMAPYLET